MHTYINVFHWFDENASGHVIHPSIILHLPQHLVNPNYVPRLY